MTVGGSDRKALDAAAVPAAGAEREGPGGTGGPERADLEPPPPRRPSPFWARSPVFAAAALAAVGWLLWDMWPDTAYFFSSTAPIDLGAPGAYHLERARPNRLVRVAGAPVAAVTGVETRGGERRVVGLFGLSLAVDRPGGAAPAAVYEGRLLPDRRGRDYAPFVAELGRRGWKPGDRWMVMRDGERPRQRWSRPLLSLLLLAVGAVNLRALVRSVAS
ncbi:MAG TPA: hypothetical protein VFR85_05900 [Anaeromyxobacteraceae bacterium]|nr:hypothetical protein [Anaeromyxobacteraceae bacterium]